MTKTAAMIETMCARLREARITLEQAEAELNIARGEGTRKQILECDASYRKALNVVIDMEDRIVEHAQRLLEVRIG